jgi:hypothetical protein
MAVEGRQCGWTQGKGNCWLSYGSILETAINSSKLLYSAAGSVQCAFVCTFTSILPAVLIHGHLEYRHLQVATP